MSIFFQQSMVLRGHLGRRSAAVTQIVASAASTPQPLNLHITDACILVVCLSTLPDGGEDGQEVHCAVEQ